MKISTKILQKSIMLTAVVLASSLSSVAFAQTCKVTDPSSTPLNVRTAPMGKIIGKVANGTVVYTTEYAEDDKGRPWTLIFNAKNDKKIGWVYREFISCY
ncbi:MULTISPECIES: SH3 domain-containing protein [unclassified Acinetobacter]|uniref:SH3 domain-containing protein n=1 Tax=unclassified Acinetobacter TaxID=196816 RepID=UPI0035B8CAB6